MSMTHSTPEVDLIELAVNGKTGLPAVIEPHTLQCLPFDSSTATITFIAGTSIERNHSATMSEYSVTVSGPELVSATYTTLPYGANPRNPVLCSTFDKIYSTLSNEPRGFILKNTGVDVFCSKAEINEENNQIVLTFENERHGIANGGLTSSVIRYCASTGVDLSESNVSVRIWASEDFTQDVLDEAANARNEHRELDLADRLNSLGAFENIINHLNDEFRQNYSFYTGDSDADFNESRDVQQLCHLLYGFTNQTGEAHPILNSNPAGGVYPTIKKKGRITSPKSGINSLKRTVGIE